MTSHNPLRTRIFALFLICFFAFLPLMPVAAALDDPNPQAAAAFLADRDSGFVLYTKNADDRRFPASTTKIMTALVVLENVDNLDQLVEVTAEDFDGVSFDSSKAGFLEGEQIPVIDLLYGLMLPSGNEAANTLARFVGDGSREAFVEKMNARAKALGCTNTHFMNPNGLHDENHYTTARDLFLIAREAMTDETFAEIVNTAQKTLSETNKTPERSNKPLKVFTTNMLIFSRNQPNYFYSFAKGMKTGHTSQAGYCLVAAAEKKGGKLISVVLGAEKPAGAAQPVTFAETKRLFDWGYSSFTTAELVKKGDTIAQVGVRLSTQDDQLVLAAAESLSGTIPLDLKDSAGNLKTEELTYTADVPETVDAPIHAGDKLGTLRVTYKDTDYGTVDLVALADITRSDVLYYADKIEHFFQSAIFKVLVIGIIILFFVYFMLLFYRARRMRIRKRQMMKSKQARYRDYDKYDQ